MSDLSKKWISISGDACHTEAEDDAMRLAYEVEMLEAENRRLREGLIECERHAHCMRIWMGVDGWRYHPIHAKKVADTARDALEELENE